MTASTAKIWLISKSADRWYPRYGYVTSVVVKRPRFQLNRGRIFKGPEADIARLFGAEDKGPIGATALILGHRDTDFAHVRTQQIGPMP